MIIEILQKKSDLLIYALFFFFVIIYFFHPTASASRRTASGMAKISWERTYDDIHGKLFVLNINVPHQTTADLQIPLLVPPFILFKS
jgi:uncharacterized membrane protein